LAGSMRSGVDPVVEERHATADNLTLREAWTLYESHLEAKGRSERTGSGYWGSLQRYCLDWLDRPLVEITPQAAHKRHVHIGNKNGKYAANATMRALRAVWRRAQRQHRGLGEPPTVNVDFFRETPREAIIEDLPAWWQGVQAIENPIRRDLFVWLLFTGCRREESTTMRWEHVDLDAGTVHFPKTKTEAFTLPLSGYLTDLLKARRACEATRAVFGKDCPWVFPAHGKTGHISEPKLTRQETKLFATPWSPHTLRHTWITISENKIAMPASHSRLLVNHAVPRSRDAHSGYIHPDVEDLRRSQQAMTDYLLAAISPKPPAEVIQIRSRKRPRRS
jgi:integrase